MSDGGTPIPLDVDRPAPHAPKGRYVVLALAFKTEENEMQGQETTAYMAELRTEATQGHAPGQDGSDFLGENEDNGKKEKERELGITVKTILRNRASKGENAVLLVQDAVSLVRIRDWIRLKLSDCTFLTIAQPFELGKIYEAYNGRDNGSRPLSAHAAAGNPCKLQGAEHILVAAVEMAVRDAVAGGTLPCTEQDDRGIIPGAVYDSCSDSQSFTGSTGPVPTLPANAFLKEMVKRYQRVEVLFSRLLIDEVVNQCGFDYHVLPSIDNFKGEELHRTVKRYSYAVLARYAERSSSSEKLGEMRRFLRREVHWHCEVNVFYNSKPAGQPCHEVSKWYVETIGILKTVQGILGE